MCFPPRFDGQRPARTQWWIAFHDSVKSGENPYLRCDALPQNWLRRSGHISFSLRWAYQLCTVCTVQCTLCTGLTDIKHRAGCFRVLDVPGAGYLGAGCPYAGCLWVVHSGHISRPIARKLAQYYGGSPLRLIFSFYILHFHLDETDNIIPFLEMFITQGRVHLDTILYPFHRNMVFKIWQYCYFNFFKV